MNGALFFADLEAISAPDQSAVQQRDIAYVAGMDYEAIPYDDLRDLALDRTSVLTAASEVRLFVQMNRAYYYAASRRASSAEAASLDESAGAADLVRGDQIRNQILLIFHKLTVSIAKRFVNSRHSLEELVSEGDAVLLRAITLFDPSRGFRFSTYATYAVRRRLARYVTSAEHAHAVPVDFCDRPALPDRCRWTLPYEHAVQAGVRWLESALYQLSQRERYIIRCRFGWGREFEPRTLQEIADELGLSRERVRQLEAKSLKKLQELASLIDEMAL